MFSVIVAILIPILSAIMAYIPYKYPFYNHQGRTTKEAKFFGVILCLTILLGGYMAYDTYSSGEENKNSQNNLKTNITVLTDSVKGVSNNLQMIIVKLDSLGYRYNPKTGTITRIKVPSNSNIILGSPKHSTIQQNKNGNNQANTQKIDSGGSGLQNNAPNYGNQAGRDLNISSERELTEQDKTTILIQIGAVQSRYNFKASQINVSLTFSSNGQKFAHQLFEYLKAQGYNTEFEVVAVTGGEVKGFLVQRDYYNKEQIDVYVGVF